MNGIISKKIARAGLIAGVYVLTALITFPISSGAIQLRLSEALCILPLLFIEAVPALFVGCILINFLTGCAFFDVILGSLITLLAALSTYFVGRIIKNTVAKIVVGGLFPVALNALLLPLVWLLYGTPQYVYFVQAVILIIGQSLAVYAVGIPLYFAVRKIFKNR